jgi:hypothetical protein
MTDILVDSNVILDILTEDPQSFEWSAQTLAEQSRQGNLVINPIVYAEISIGFNQPEELEAALPEAFFRRDQLPDFYIGAHAAIAGMTLLTRDVNRYKTYFQLVPLITP